MKPHKISTQSDIQEKKKYKQQLSEWAEWVETLWSFTKFIFKQMLKVSVFYLQKQKSFIPKKNIFLAVFSKHAKIIPKDGASHPNFQWRFWLVHAPVLCYTIGSKHLFLNYPWGSLWQSMEVLISFDAKNGVKLQKIKFYMKSEKKKITRELCLLVGILTSHYIRLSLSWQNKWNE